MEYNKRGVLHITVFDVPNENKAKVVIAIDNEANEDFSVWMCACEYLLHKTAQKSKAGYEKALELLRKGAMTYKDQAPKGGE